MRISCEIPSKALDRSQNTATVLREPTKPLQSPQWTQKSQKLYYVQVWTCVWFLKKLLQSKFTIWLCAIVTNILENEGTNFIVQFLSSLRRLLEAWITAAVFCDLSIVVRNLSLSPFLYNGFTSVNFNWFGNIPSYKSLLIILQRVTDIKITNLPNHWHRHFIPTCRIFII